MRPLRTLLFCSASGGEGAVLARVLRPIPRGRRRKGQASDVLALQNKLAGLANRRAMGSHWEARKKLSREDIGGRQRLRAIPLTRRMRKTSCAFS